MFGRQAKLLVDFNVEEDYDPAEKLQYHICSHDTPDEVVSTNKKAIDDAVKKNIEQAQEKQKEYYDKKHGCSSCYSTGSLVWKKGFSTKKKMPWWEIG